MYEASITDQPHSAYEAPSSAAAHHGPRRWVRSSQTMAAAAAAVLSTVTTYTARSMSSRGKRATSTAKGLERYVPKSGRKLVP